LVLLKNPPIKLVQVRLNDVSNKTFVAASLNIVHYQRSQNEHLQIPDFGTVEPVVEAVLNFPVYIQVRLMGNAHIDASATDLNRRSHLLMSEVH
jgi:hypothetical protein